MNMSEKFKTKYRIASAMLQSYDYKRAGMYFITICTKNRMHFFGEIQYGIMKHSELGICVITEWTNTPAIRPDMNLELGAFVVMPDHFHAILIVGENEYNSHFGRRRGGDGGSGSGFDTDDDNDAGRDAMHCVSTTGDGIGARSGAQNANRKNAFKPQSKNLASIIRGFKSSVTTYARKNNIQFDWQPRFHDRMIRNQAEFNRISNYILNNPMNWGK